MLKKLGNVSLRNPLIIAPMAGVSNAAFRELCLEFGAGLVCCEMVSDKAIFYKNEKTAKMIDVGNGHPVSLQLFGSDPSTMAYATRVLDKESNCDIIDINMGCPVNKVVKTGSGSALMKNEDLAVEIVKSVLDNTSKPVTVKMRLGYDFSHINYLSLAKKLENTGIKAICLHGRTRSQMYEACANWDHIKSLHEAISIPVIGNGDIKSLDDYIKYSKYCDAIMIGRAIVGNPFLIKEISDYESGITSKEYSYIDKFNMCLKHAKKLCDLKGEDKAIREMRGLAPHYISGLYSSSIYKNKMSSLSSYNELVDLFNEYEIVLKENELV